MICKKCGCGPEETTETHSASGIIAAVIIAVMSVMIAAVAFVLLRVPAMQEERTQEAYGKRYAEYVRAVLDCVYHGDLNGYISITDSSMTAAQRIHDQKTEQLVQELCTLYQVDSSLLSKERLVEMEQFAELLLHKTVYSIGDGTESDGTYCVPVVIQPIGFWENAGEAYDAYCTSEGLPSEAADYDTLTPEQQQDAENTYAADLLAILYEAAEEMAYVQSECYSARIRIDADGLYGLDEKEWQAIESLLLNKS